MSKLYAAALVLGAFAGTALLASVGCSEAHDEDTGVALGAAGEGDAGIAPGTLVISAVYPLGGRTGAAFKHDYVEILNRSSKDVTLDDAVSLQLAATGTATFEVAVPLKGTIAAGGYFLVELKNGTVGTAGADLPDPDQPLDADSPSIAENTTSKAQGAGKVALALGTEPLKCGGLGSACPPAKLLDLVGWGETNAFEGAGSAPKFEDNTKALARPGNGCADTNNNAKDFALADPAPRNKATDAVNCNPPKPDAGVDANSIPRPPGEPDPGKETPYDAGSGKADSGAPSAATPAADDDCAVGAVGAGGFGRFTPLAGLAIAAMAIVRRRRARRA